MIDHQQQDPDPSDAASPSEESSPSWVEFRLKEFKGNVKYSAGVIMDHYLVVLAHDEIIIKDEWYYKSENPTIEQTATLLAFNLEDHTIQEAKVDARLLTRQYGFYNFLKYGENQIIKYGGAYESHGGARSMVCITVESFEPFKVNIQEIEDEKKRDFSKKTAQIYKDCLYVLGRIESGSQNELWSFDLKNNTWKLCETTGEAPGFNDYYDEPSSIIYHDNLYVYGLVQESTEKGFGAKKRSYADLYMLDLKSMEWKKIAQEQKYLGEIHYENRSRVGATIYQDHLVTLEQFVKASSNALCFLNLHNKQHTWSTFSVGSVKDDSRGTYRENDATTGSLMTYKDSVLSLASAEDGQELIVSTINIESFGISAPKSAEEEYLSGLFLSPNESDVAFKVDETIIPAHKKVLVKKSRYFEGLFNSGMAESKQEVIEIKDCGGYKVFKEFLSWIYQGTVNLKNSKQAITLYVLADKYLQNKLSEKCLNFLTSSLNMDNFPAILDFAHQENVSQIKVWCTKLFNDKLDVDNVARLIKYLVDRQEDPAFKEDNRGFRNQALDFVLDNFIEIFENEEGEIQAYEDFLLRNIEMDTISSLAHFFGRKPIKGGSRKSHQKRKRRGSEDEEEEEEDKTEEQVETEKDPFEKCTAHLKEAVFEFVEENAKTIMKSKMVKDFTINFFRDLFLYTTDNLSNVKAELRKGKKRMEPSQNGFDEENPELKKTKKSDPGNSN